jgi:hypothetical protein
MEIQYLPHEQRMLDERQQLEDRLSGLNSFLNKGQPVDMDDADWELLNAQAFAMRNYNYVLSARIRRFKAKYKAQPIAVKQVPSTRLPGACFDDCTQECVDEPFHKNCPGYCDLK